MSGRDALGRPTTAVSGTARSARETLRREADHARRHAATGTVRAVPRRPGRGRPPRVRTRDVSRQAGVPQERRAGGDGGGGRRGDPLPPQRPGPFPPRGARRRRHDLRQGRAGAAERPAAECRNAAAPARRRHHAHGAALRPQQRHPARDHGRGGLDAHHRRSGRHSDDAGHRRSQTRVRGRLAGADAGVRRQRPRLFRPAGAGQPVDLGRRRLLRMDRRPPRRCAAGRGSEERRRLHRPRRGRCAPFGRRGQAPDLPRHSRREGDGSEQPHRLRPERRSDSPHERRAAPPGGAGLAGIVLAEVADPHLAAGPGSRRREDGRHLVSRSRPPGAPGTGGGRRGFRHHRGHAGEVADHRSGHRSPDGRRHARRARTRLGGRPDGRLRPPVDRLRRDVGRSRTGRTGERPRVAELARDGRVSPDGVL